MQWQGENEAGKTKSANQERTAGPTRMCVLGAEEKQKSGRHSIRLPPPGDWSGLVPLSCAASRPLAHWRPLATPGERPVERGAGVAIIRTTPSSARHLRREESH